MDVTEALDKLSVIVNTEDFKQSVQVACELRQSIAANLGIATAESSGQLSDLVKSEQVLLAKRLQKALTALQVLATDHVSELGSEIGDQMLHRVTEVVNQLDKDLNIVIATVNETVSEILMKKQVIQSKKEQIASVVTVADQEIIKDKLPPANDIDTVNVELFTAMDSTNAIEEATHSEENISNDKQGNLISVDSLDNATVTIARPAEELILKPASDKIVDVSEVTGKSATVNGKCAYCYCLVFVENQDFDHLTQDIIFSIVMTYHLSFTDIIAINLLSSFQIEIRYSSSLTLN